MFFKQVKHLGGNFSYIVSASSRGIVIDPSFNAHALISLARERGLSLDYVIDTHDHRDHVAGNGEIKALLGSRIVAHRLAELDTDLPVDDGDILRVGGVVARIIHTPGHSPDSMCILINGKLFTGDTLFVGDCGRTDLPGGSAEDMYISLFNKLMTLDDGVEVYPGHDYGSKPHSTIGDEKRTNYTLEERSLEEFIEFMRRP